MPQNEAEQAPEITLSDLPIIRPTELSTLLRKSIGDSTTNATTETQPLTTTDTLTTTTTTSTPKPDSPKELAIIDVRDSDHIGGHIKSSKHVPSATLDARMPELVQELRDVPVVVFHCALSQQRGPKAALRYMRERRRIVGGEQEEREGDEQEEGGNAQGKKKKQEVFVLENGFKGWQELYGEDVSLTEGYVKDIWSEL